MTKIRQEIVSNNELISNLVSVGNVFYKNVRSGQPGQNKARTPQAAAQARLPQVTTSARKL